MSLSKWNSANDSQCNESQIWKSFRKNTQNTLYYTKCWFSFFKFAWAGEGTQHLFVNLTQCFSLYPWAKVACIVVVSVVVLNIFVLSVVLLNVIKLNAQMLIVIPSIKLFWVKDFHVCQCHTLVPFCQMPFCRMMFGWMSLCWLSSLLNFFYKNIPMFVNVGHSQSVACIVNIFWRS